MELVDAGKLIPIAESTLDAEAVNRDASHSGAATPMAINPTTLGLDAESIFFFDKNSFFGREYPVDENGEEITSNNITETHKKITLCKVCDYKPSGAICALNVPSLFVLDAGTIPGENE
jgi:hypothetical protein